MDKSDHFVIFEYNIPLLDFGRKLFFNIIFWGVIVRGNNKDDCHKLHKAKSLCCEQPTSSKITYNTPSNECQTKVRSCEIANY
jgi:hypothetical protein